MKDLSRLLVCLVAIISFSVPRDLYPATPKLVERVTDQTGTLTATQKTNLDRDLLAQEKATSNQEVILIVPSLEGEDIEGFTNRVFRENKLGQKGKNNGILIVLAKKDRKIRIEVGYGLEGRLTDGMAGRIIREEMSPRFKQGDFYGGFKAAITKINLAIKGEYQAEESPSSDKVQSKTTLFVVAVAILLFVIAILSSVHIALGTIIGAMAGYLLMHFFFASPPLSIVGGAVGAVIGFILGIRTSNGESFGSSIIQTIASSDSSGSGSWSGGGNSGGGGDSGFSGGGGDSGGGGASGSY